MGTSTKKCQHQNVEPHGGMYLNEDGKMNVKVFCPACSTELILINITLGVHEMIKCESIEVVQEVKFKALTDEMIKKGIRFDVSKINNRMERFYNV